MWLCSSKQNCIADGLRLIWAQWLALTLPARKDLAGAPMFFKGPSPTNTHKKKKIHFLPSLFTHRGPFKHRDQRSGVSGTSCLKSTIQPRLERHKTQQSIFIQGLNYSATILKWHIDNNIRGWGCAYQWCTACRCRGWNWLLRFLLLSLHCDH